MTSPHTSDFQKNQSKENGMESSSLASPAVYVSPVPASISSDVLAQFFGCVGPVMSVQVAERDGQSNNGATTATAAALVTFATPAQATTALALSGTMLDDKQITVSAASARPKQQRSEGDAQQQQQQQPQPPSEKAECTIRVENVSAALTTEQLAMFFGACGAIKFCSVVAGDEPRQAKIAIVEFASRDAVAAALCLSGTVLGGKAVVIRNARELALSAAQNQKKHMAHSSQKTPTDEKKKRKRRRSSHRDRSRSRGRHRGRLKVFVKFSLSVKLAFPIELSFSFSLSFQFSFMVEVSFTISTPRKITREEELSTPPGSAFFFPLIQQQCAGGCVL
jgi:RNA recognition motif-containing protein